MNIYFVDHTANDELAPILGKDGLGFTEFDHDNPATCTYGVGDLLFLHTEEKEAWFEDAGKNEYTDYVFISRAAPAALPSKSELLANTHLCEIGALELGQNSKVGEFLVEWKNGNKKWDLLLLEPFPENLIAMYLLDVAAKELNTDTIVVEDDICKNAHKEFMDRRGSKSCDWTDRDIRRGATQELFREISTQ